MTKIKIAVFVSGNGSNLDSLIKSVDSNILENASLELVFSNNKNALALEKAKKANIPILYDEQINYPTSEEFDLALLTKLKKYNIDLIVLAGYLKIISPPILNVFKDRILNIHPSLLPDFGGKNMYGIKVHQSVINSNVKISGCTVHLVTEEIDKGRILAQSKLDVLSGDTPDKLAKRVLELEHNLFPKTINEFIHKEMKISSCACYAKTS